MSSTSTISQIYSHTASSSSPIVRFKLLNKKRKRGSADNSDVTSMSSPSQPLSRNSRQRSLANLAFTSLNDQGQLESSSALPSQQLRRPSHGGAASPVTATSPTQAPITTARTHTRSTSASSLASFSDVRVHGHATGTDVPEPTNRRTRRPASTSLSAPSSPRHTLGEGWYFTPSVTPVVVPTPTSSSPRTRKRSTGARSVPSSPKRSPSPPLHTGYFPQQPQLTRVSASTSAMPTYPRPGPSYSQAPLYGAMVDSLGLHSRHTYQDAAPEYQTDDDEDAMFVGGSARRFPRRSSADPRSPVPETETDGEFIRPLPTSRFPSTQPQPQTDSPLVALRWLSVIGPNFAALFHLSRLIKPRPAVTSTDTIISRADHFVCVIWALFAAYQSLSFTTGLLHRWRFYYPNTVSVVVRILALQVGICWTAMQLTYRIVDHTKRPLLCWTLIGTCTCIGKAIQMWATSNLRGGIDDDRVKIPTRPSTPMVGANALLLESETTTSNAWIERCLDIVQNTADLIVPGGTSDVIRPRSNSNPTPPPTMARLVKRGRRWDWNKVWRKCGGPAAAIYLIMAWSLLLDREFGRTTTGGC